jgi:hypothetical protein
MKLTKIVCILALSVILTLLIPLFPTTAHAAAALYVEPYEGRVGTWVEINGFFFEENENVFIYFSSQKVSLGDEITEDVTAYEHLVTANTTDAGHFDRSYGLFLPDAITDGTEVEDVHSGQYYFYATYYRSHEIVAYCDFMVLGGEISLDIEEGVVGTEVEISGEGLRPDQAITIEYDGNLTNISGGDERSDHRGDFTCKIIIPESAAGSHVITAIDESGDTPEAEFTVTPMITANPTAQVTGGEVTVNGLGFAKRETIAITLDGEELIITPLLPQTDHAGSFEASFIVPTSGGFGTRTVEVSDESNNEAETPMDILGGIMVSPATSESSPGHVGMELVISGAGFSAGTEVTITYSNNGEELPVATVTAEEGTFQVKFTVPPGAIGSHNITASGAASTATATFIMEAQSPPIPIPLTPAIAGTTEERAYFDWSEVSDDSGVSYSLQVALDSDFNALLLYKMGLEASEYTLVEGEELATTEQETPYYWRVKAVDNARNESDWTYPRLFYVGFSLSAMPVWAFYVIGVVVAAGLAMVGYWVWKNRTRGKGRTV